MRIIIIMIFIIFYSYELNSNNNVTFYIYNNIEKELYLGCLNCDKYDSESVWNRNGNYGSKYSQTSIWNKYGTYGGKYSNYSPFNKHTNSPPVIIGSDNNFYGYFTVNRYKSERADFDLVKIIYENWENIQEDVSGWYSKIFD